MAATRPIVLFSTNTRLAYRINEHYYGGKHFVWCTPFAASTSVLATDVAMPPSSTPCALFRVFERDIGANDLHSTVIKNNRVGLLTGAVARRRQGIITARQETEIRQIVNSADLPEFKPMLYVIPYALVENISKPVPPGARANPFSQEFVIASLPRKHFAVLEFE